MKQRLVRVGIFVLLGLPALWLGWQMALWFNFMPHELTANPQKFITQFTGQWAVRLLILTLLASPLARWGWRQVMAYRRMLGLYAAFYALLHVLNYFLLDHALDMEVIVKDILKRPAISFGAVSSVILLVLTATSTRGMMRRLRQRWGQIHQSVYLVAILVPLHGYLMVKGDRQEILLYAGVLGGLLLWRLWVRWVRSPRLFMKKAGH